MPVFVLGSHRIWDCNWRGIAVCRKGYSACTWCNGGDFTVCRNLLVRLRFGCALYACFYNARNHYTGGRGGQGRNSWEYSSHFCKYSSGSVIHFSLWNGSCRRGSGNSNRKSRGNIVLCLFYEKKGGCTEYEYSLGGEKTAKNCFPFFFWECPMHSAVYCPDLPLHFPTGCLGVTGQVQLQPWRQQESLRC